MCGSFLPDIEGVHQRMDELKPIVFRNLLCDKEGFSRDVIDGFVGFDFSESGVLVTGVAKAAYHKPLHRNALQLKPPSAVGRRSFLPFIMCAALRTHTFSNADRV